MTPTWLDDPRPGARCAVVAEVAQAHDGSLGMAHAFLDAAADAGADAIKFQTHIASAESTPAEPWRTRFSPQDASRFDYWRRMEFTPTQWRGLHEHAHRRELHFLSSAFSLEAVDLLTKIGVRAWKVASGEIANRPLLDAMAATGLPIILSTGMSALPEIDRSVAWVQAAGVPLAVLQCASAYPCPPELVGLNVLGEFRERYGCAVGLSDHSATIFPGIAAATLGAEVLEVHLTLSRQMFGPDVVASLTPEELAELVRGVRWVQQAQARPVDKSAVAEDVAPLRAIFMKSVVAQRELPAGTVLAPEDLAAKKPGTGIPAAELPTLVGHRLRRTVKSDEIIRREDLEPMG